MRHISLHECMPAFLAGSGITMDLGIARIMTFFFAKPCAQHCQILADRCEITPAGLSMGSKLSRLSMGSNLSPVVKLQCGDDAEVKT